MNNIFRSLALILAFHFCIFAVGTQAIDPAEREININGSDRMNELSGGALILTTGEASRKVVTLNDPISTPGTQISLNGLPSNAFPRSIAFFGNDVALIGDSGASRLFVIQPSTGTLMATISLPSGCTGSGALLVSPQSDYAVVASTSTLCAVQAPFTSSSTVTSLPLGSNSGAGGQVRTVVLDGNGRAFVRTTGGIKVVDPPYTSITFSISVSLSSVGTIDITPDGSTLLVTAQHSVGSSIYVYTAPFSASSTSQTITGNTGLSNLTISPDGTKAIYAVNTPFDHIVRTLNAPFAPGAAGETLTMPQGYGGCAEVDFAADSSTAILSGCASGSKNVLIRAPFTAAGAQSSLLPINGSNANGGPGAGRFLPARYLSPEVPDEVPFDYDGDGKTDFSVFRPADGAWYLQRTTAGFQGLQFGADGDKLTPADYDGDGKTDIAIYRPSTGIWYILNSSNGTVSYPVFGVAEDLPAPGDYDGDGKADLTVFRPSQGTWYRTNSSNGSTFGMQFGANGDVPTVGDFDGDGKNDLGIFRPSVGDWYNIRSSNGDVFGERFGQTGDRIAPADFDGDGKTDIAIYRPSTGLWVIRNSATATYSYDVFGAPADIPVAGDYDGDGRADIAVWRPSDGTWYIKRSDNSQFIIFPWGQNGDKPTPSAYGN